MPAVVVAAQAAALELVAPVVAVEQVMVHLLKEQRAVRQVLTQAQAVVAAQMVLALALVAVQE
jgi:hypothetical protein